MVEFMNITNALYEQIAALLDLMQSCDDCVDVKSIKTTSEMSLNMLDDMLAAAEDVFDDWKNGMLKAPEGKANDSKRIN